LATMSAFASPPSESCSSMVSLEFLHAAGMHALFEETPVHCKGHTCNLKLLKPKTRL
jgi:hypothetical protein